MGEPIFTGDDFPRVIGEYRVTEGEYAIYFRDCAVALFIMEQPVSDRDHLLLVMQMQYFIRGALHVSSTDGSYEQFLENVENSCRGEQVVSLADGVYAASQGNE